MKILIISHNPISTQSNMGITFLSLFSQFKKEELCQMYIYPTLPNMSMCASYYRVTDKEALASLFVRKKIGREIEQREITQTHGAYEKAKDESIYRNKKNERPSRRLLRDSMWKLSRWYNEDLKKWLDRERPECIFVAPGPAKFLYDFALKISEKFNIPIVTYICDELYFVKTPTDVLGKLQLDRLQKRVTALMDKTVHLLAISEEIRTLYQNHFAVNATTLMTGATLPAAGSVKLSEHPKEISYFGNVRCNRYVSLGEIGAALDDLNQQYGESYTLKIYTAEKDREIMESLSQYSSVRLCGFVTGEAFQNAMENAQLLLHVEAFDENSVDVVKHSISTKIANSLASGIPLLAYGPEEISSMQHLRRNGCAITATKKEDLKKVLLFAFSDPEARQLAAENGLKAAKEYHNSLRTSMKLKEIIHSAIDSKRNSLM